MQASERLVYTALNQFKLDAGVSFFGGIGVVFNNSDIKEMAMLSPMDSGDNLWLQQTAQPIYNRCIQQTAQPIYNRCRQLRIRPAHCCGTACESLINAIMNHGGAGDCSTR